MDSPSPSKPSTLDPLFIAGPTGSGKSAVALALAQSLGRAEIVNADAFQVYRGLDILTAAPSTEDRAATAHHLYGILDPRETCSAAAYAERALPLLQEIAARGSLPLVTGGTGLYIKALTHGLTDLPPADPFLREALDALEPEALVAWLEKVDPVGASQTNLANPRYVQRALEITLQSGRPMSEIKTGWKSEAPAYRGILIIRDREDLYARIDKRVPAMFEAGLLDEVQALRELSPTAEKAIGIVEARRHLAGETSLDECIAAIAQATRRYAKRQLTWFKRESGFHAIEVAPDERPDSVVQRILEIFPALQ